MGRRKTKSGRLVKRKVGKSHRPAWRPFKFTSAVWFLLRWGDICIPIRVSNQSTKLPDDPDTSVTTSDPLLMIGSRGSGFNRPRHECPRGIMCAQTSNFGGSGVAGGRLTTWSSPYIRADNQIRQERSLSITSPTEYFPRMKDHITGVARHSPVLTIAHPAYRYSCLVALFPDSFQYTAKKPSGD